MQKYCAQEARCCIYAESYVSICEFEMTLDIFVLSILISF